MGAFLGMKRTARDVYYSHPCSAEVKIQLDQDCTNPGRQVAQTTKLCTVALGVCVSWVRKWLHIVHLVPRILVWLLDIWKICPLSVAVPLIPKYASRLREGKTLLFLLSISTSNNRSIFCCSVCTTSRIYEYRWLRRTAMWYQHITPESAYKELCYKCLPII